MLPGRKPTRDIDFLVQMLSDIQAEVSRDNVQRSIKNSDKARGSKFVFLCAKKVGLSLNHKFSAR